ncbi:glycosyltransferase [Candidatus Bathyarchaeota archaeon]|nr:glycosyltransferase [Candidatus Bathyarchaeota archaeon]
MSKCSSKISIIIPAYNGEKTILKTLSSIMNQSYKPTQLIVVDDASKDSTVSLVENFIATKSSVNVFNLVRHEKNLGLSRSLNDGIRTSKGEYVLILHQDCELVGNRWLEKALLLMEDKKVAVVTGYYGVSDVEDENFVKRAFGVLRKQFHLRPEATCERVTFSEGKCDLYRKNLLVKIGGFPEEYRIAGEDLIVSYKLRSMGYDIIKCYDLAVIQRFGGAAESFWGNVGKEFLFGKVMGGVFSEFKFFLFKGAKNSNYSNSRSKHRSTQPPFVVALIVLSFFCLLEWRLIFAILGLLLLRFIYYIYRVFPELKKYQRKLDHPFIETLATSGIGFFTDFAYGLGFPYGLLQYAIKKKL